VTSQERALAEIARFLSDRPTPYMIIGGMANAVWGVPRATLDVDLTLWAEPDEVRATIDALGRAFDVLVSDPEAFVHETRVLPLQTRDGVRIDVIFALLPFERGALERAVTRTVAGAEVRFCTAEDLVLHKIISERPRDLEDAREVLVRQAAVIDRDYLDPRVQELADLMERPEIWSRYLKWLSST
jgi:predicted nucleotidyltransferase